LEVLCLVDIGGRIGFSNGAVRILVRCGNVSVEETFAV
jgi:hypothetical protein